MALICRSLLFLKSFQPIQTRQMIFTNLPIFILLCAFVYLTLIYGLLKMIEMQQHKDNAIGDRSQEIDRLKTP